LVVLAAPVAGPWVAPAGGTPSKKKVNNSCFVTEAQPAVKKLPAVAAAIQSQSLLILVDE
jgi:hypothetical protein